MMRLTVEGYLTRTSGSASPFEEKKLSFEGLSKGPVDLPWPECHFEIEPRENGANLVLDCIGQRKEAFLKMGIAQEFRFERAILALNIKFALEE